MKPTNSSHPNPHKTQDAFGPQNYKTDFAKSYSTGDIPCRIFHGGSGINSIQWNIHPDELDYTNLLPLFAEGLRETSHPYVFLSRKGFSELTCVATAARKTIPLLPQIIQNIRLALMEKDEETWKASLVAIQDLSNCVKESLNEYLRILHIFLDQKLKKCLDPKYRTIVQDTLQVLDQNGGKEGRAIIKSKVPTYMV